jgi:N-acetyl-gamma-glutamylphosphate reductase
MAIQAAIFGASGYTGQELIRILSGHPQVNLVAVTSRRYAGRPVTEIYPSLSGMTTLTYSNATPQEISKLCDVAFLALPHGISMDVAPVFIGRESKSSIFLPIIVCETLLFTKNGMQNTAVPIFSDRLSTVFLNFTE